MAKSDGGNSQDAPQYGMLELRGSVRPGSGKSNLRQVNPDGSPYEGNQAGKNIPLPPQAPADKDVDWTEPMYDSAPGKALGGRQKRKTKKGQRSIEGKMGRQRMDRKSRSKAKGQR